MSSEDLEVVDVALDDGSHVFFTAPAGMSEEERQDFALKARKWAEELSHEDSQSV